MGINGESRRGLAEELLGSLVERCVEILVRCLVRRDVGEGLETLHEALDVRVLLE